MIKCGSKEDNCIFCAIIIIAQNKERIMKRIYSQNIDPNMFQPEQDNPQMDTPQPQSVYPDENDPLVIQIKDILMKMDPTHPRMMDDEVAKQLAPESYPDWNDKLEKAYEVASDLVLYAVMVQGSIEEGGELLNAYDRRATEPRYSDEWSWEYKAIIPYTITGDGDVEEGDMEILEVSFNDEFDQFNIEGQIRRENPIVKGSPIDNAYSGASFDMSKPNWEQEFKEKMYAIEAEYEQKQKDRRNEVKERWLSKNPGKTERDFWEYYYH